MKNKRKTFKEAVILTEDVKDCYKPGLQGLGKHSTKVILTNNKDCGGSLDIDACTTKLNPNDNRWDYAFAYNEKVYFIEVHTANTGEVTTVINKLNWLKTWLLEKAPEINQLKAESPYYWIQSGKFNILPTSRQYRRIVAQGIKPVPKLSL